MAVNDATYNLSFHEILTKVNNAKDKPKKIEVLRKYDTNELRMFLKGAFSEKLEWLLPEGIYTKRGTSRHRAYLVKTRS